MADTEASNVVVAPKRRGRKPKENKVEVINTKVNIIDSFNVSSKVDETTSGESSKSANKKGDDNSESVKNPTETIEEVPVKKGRRGRKPKYVYSSYDISSTNEESLSGSQAVEDENIIVRLNISNDTLNESNNTHGLSNLDEHPYAYNHDTYNNISNINDVLVPNQHQFEIDKSNNENSTKIVNVLNEFAEKNKNNEWPINTSISCYWCVHRFDNSPVGIPINFKNDTFEVFGCFCSLECAAAYNFSENNSQDEMWERYQLLNMMSRRMKFGNVIKPAPPRLALKMFGGNMDIDTFRNIGKGNKLMNINFPPMTSITQQLEEINDFEINNDFKYIPVDDERVNKYKEKIIFKRNKPLIDKNKSLESTMNLKYSS
jgi:hypothetical protein